MRFLGVFKPVEVLWLAKRYLPSLNFLAGLKTHSRPLLARLAL